MKNITVNSIPSLTKVLKENKIDFHRDIRRANKNHSTIEYIIFNKDGKEYWYKFVRTGNKYPLEKVCVKTNNGFTVIADFTEPPKTTVKKETKLPKKSSIDSLLKLGNKIDNQKKAEYQVLAKEQRAEQFEQSMAKYDRRTANVTAEITDVEFKKDKTNKICLNEKGRVVFKSLSITFTWDTVNDLKEPIHDVVTRRFGEFSTNFLYFVIINTIIDNIGIDPKDKARDRKLLWNTTEKTEGVMKLIDVFNTFSDQELFTLDVGLKPGTYDIAQYSFEYSHR